MFFYVFDKGIKKLGNKEKGQGRYTGKAEGRKLKSKNYIELNHLQNEVQLFFMCLLYKLYSNMYVTNCKYSHAVNKD